jgi:serine kinase of HPr protein (carbohydrate metabolism regulator)
MLPIHGASLQIGAAGVVLVGASHSGKTTTSLHLAARGHTLLGDEIALIRLATGAAGPLRPGAGVDAAAVRRWG